MAQEASLDFPRYSFLSPTAGGPEGCRSTGATNRWHRRNTFTGSGCERVVQAMESQRVAFSARRGLSNAYLSGTRGMPAQQEATLQRGSQR